jgi:hypothetical protein
MELALVEHDAPRPPFFVGDYCNPLSLVTESGVELVSFSLENIYVFCIFSYWIDWKLFCLFSFPLGDIGDVI